MFSFFSEYNLKFVFYGAINFSLVIHFLRRRFYLFFYFLFFLFFLGGAERSSIAAVAARSGYGQLCKVLPSASFSFELVLLIEFIQNFNGL